MTSQFSWLGFFTDAGIPLREAEKYSLQFDDNRMKPDMLPDLTKELLNDLGITLIGDILAILRHGRQALKQLERGQLPTSGRDEERTVVQPLRKTMASGLPELDAQKTKRSKKASKSKPEAAAQVSAVAAMTSAVRLGPLPPSPSASGDFSALSANGTTMEEQPRRIITRPLSAALPAYHSDAVVSNASQTTVIRKAEQPQSAHSRLGNGTSVAVAAGAVQRQVVHATTHPEALSSHRHSGPGVSQTSSDRATRLVESVTTAAVPSPSQAIKQTVSMRLPSSMPPVSTETRHNQHHYDAADGDGGEGLRRIVHAVVSSSDPSYQRPLQMQTVSERGGHAAADAMDPGRPSTQVRLSGGGGSGGGVKSVITRVVPPLATRQSDRGVDGISDRRTGASHQPLSAASLSKLHGSYRDDDDDDAVEEDNRMVAVRLPRKSSSTTTPPPAKRLPSGQASSSSGWDTRVAKPAVKSRLGAVIISPQTTDKPPSLSSRSEPRLRQSKASRSSVFNRLGEMS